MDFLRDLPQWVRIAIAIKFAENDPTVELIIDEEEEEAGAEQSGWVVKGHQPGS